MSKPGRVWFPLDANFTRDPAVIDAGERAGWLFLAMLGQTKLAGSRGYLTRGEVAALGIHGYAARLNALERAGLIESNDDGASYVIPSWPGWGSSDRAQYMREYRRRQAEPDPRDDGT